MTATRQAQDLGPRDLLRTITGYDTEGTYFSGPLHEAEYQHGRDTLNMIIGRCHVEVNLTAQLTTTGKDGA